MNKKAILGEVRYHLTDHIWINNNSYIPIISENTFLRDPGYYIEKAYERSQCLFEYDICKISNKDRLRRQII